MTEYNSISIKKFGGAAAVNEKAKYYLFLFLKVKTGQVFVTDCKI
jgi:hypothetical protein